MQHAILHGDEITGATTFQLVRELDAGPVFGVVTEPVGPTTPPATCWAGWPGPARGCWWPRWTGSRPARWRPGPQPADGVSLAPKVTPRTPGSTGTSPAPAIGRQIRACTPQPGAWTELAGARLKLGPAGQPGTPRDGAPLAPGELRVERSRVLVGTGTDPVVLGDVQPHGKRPMAAAAWARGLRLAEPARLA